MTSPWLPGSVPVLTRTGYNKLRPKQDNGQALVGGCGLQRSDDRGELTTVEASSRSGRTRSYPVGERSGSDWITTFVWVLGVYEDGVFRMIMRYLFSPYWCNTAVRLMFCVRLLLPRKLLL